MELKKMLKEAALVGVMLIGHNYLLFGITNMTFQHWADKYGEGYAKIEAESLLDRTQKLQNDFLIAGKVFTYGIERAAEKWARK